MKIAVASCTKIKQTFPQPVWQEIQQEQPDVLLLLGDNIYLEHDYHSDPIKLQEDLQEHYNSQFSEPNFAALLANLRARNATILAIYDDHDFIGNNRCGGDQNPALGLTARTEFISRFNPPRTGSDVYSLSKFGLVDIVVLDERFYRTSPSVSRSDRDAILGSQQWAWLDQVVADFENSQASYLLIASSTTIHTWGDESWEEYPSAFERLRQLIGGKKGMLVASGDVHRNAVYDDSGIVEIVTSAVARNGLVFGSPRKNYGIFNFDDQRAQIELRSLKAGGRFNFTIPLNNWTLP